MVLASKLAVAAAVVAAAATGALGASTVTLSGLTMSTDVQAAFTDRAFGLSGALSFNDVSPAYTQYRVLEAGESAEPGLSTKVVSVDGKNVTLVELSGSEKRVYFTASLNGETQDSGFTAWTGTLPPASISASVMTAEAGEVEVVLTASLDVMITLDPAQADSSVTASSDAALQAISAGVSLVPLFVVLAVAVLTRRVEAALGAGVFLASMILEGEVAQGYKTALLKFLVGAVSDEYNQQVILFTMFLSGLVGLMQRSGGILGLTTILARYAKTSRSGQFVAFGAGLLIFFDDYANALVAGGFARPIVDALFVSREKLAFIVDATSAPVAALFPISSWTGFESGTLDEQIQAIRASYEADGLAVPDGIPTTGYEAYLESIPYRFYPIFMILFQVLLLFSRREFGPMLVSERLTQVYRRTDGGRGALRGGKTLQDMNEPPKGLPARWWNMIVPLVLVVFLIIFVMVRVGIENAEAAGLETTFTNIVRNTDSYLGLMYGTMGASLLTFLFYLPQHQRDGAVVPPTRASCTFASGSEEAAKVARAGSDEEPFTGVTRYLITPNEMLDAWLNGLTTIFGAVVVLVLAWAMGDAMVAVGADRLFAEAIENDTISIENLPALTFVLSFFIAMCTGSSWSTMSLVFPLVISRTMYEKADFNETITNAVVAAVLSGAVCGDHASPISDTTVLSSVATQCEVTAHVVTQAPYALTVALWSLLVGYLPAGHDAFGPAGALPLGLLCLIITVYGLGVPVLVASGRWDPVQELYLRVRSDRLLSRVKEDTRLVVATGEVPRAAPSSSPSDKDAGSATASEPGVDGIVDEKNNEVPGDNEVGQV